MIFADSKILFTQLMYRKATIFTAVITLVFSIGFNQAILIFIYSILGLVIINLRSRYLSLALSRAILQSFATVVFIWLLLAALGLPFELSPVIFFTFVTVQLLRQTDKELVSKFPVPINPLIFLGPLVVVVSVLIGDITHGGNLSWAMAGDSRNHINWINTVAESNGVVLTTYPYLPHGVMGTLLFAFGDNSSRQIQEIIFLYSRAWILILILLSLLSAATIMDLRVKSRLLSTVSLIVVGLVPISSVFLENSIENGFLTTTFATLFLFALIPEFLFGFGIVSVLFGGISTVLTVFTFPTLAPTAAFSTLYLFAKGKSAMKGRNSGVLTFVLIGILGLSASLIFTHAPKAIGETLNLGGRVAGVGISISVFFVLLILITSALNVQSRANFALLIFATFASINLFLLSILTDRFSYYFVKSLWIATSILAIVAAIALTVYVRNQDSRIRLVLAVGALIACVGITNFPIKFEGPESPSIYKFIKGGDLISPSMGNTVIELIEHHPRSISWNLYPVPQQQVANIWEALGYGDSAEIFFWSYSGDVSSLQEVCSIAVNDAPSTIYVSNSEIQDYVAFRCRDMSLKVTSVRDFK